MALRRALGFVVALAIAAGCFALSTTAAEKAPSWAVYFSPQGGCTAAIERELGAAKSSVYVQAYSFTSAPIAKEL